MNRTYYLKVWNNDDKQMGKEITRQEFMDYQKIYGQDFQKHLIAGRTASVMVCCGDGTLNKQKAFNAAVWFMSGRYTMHSYNLIEDRIEHFPGIQKTPHT